MMTVPARLAIKASVSCERCFEVQGAALDVHLHSLKQLTISTLRPRHDVFIHTLILHRDGDYGGSPAEVIELL